MSRYLRIAAAVIFALLGMALVALWARSYYSEDYLEVSMGDNLIYLNSRAGVTTSIYQAGFLRRVPDYGIDSFVVPVREAPRWLQQLFSFAIGNDPAPYLTLPYWFLAASSLALAALLAFKRTWRFSLRSVLVATTILAALLGLAVYAV